MLAYAADTLELIDTGAEKTELEFEVPCVRIGPVVLVVRCL